MKIPLKCPFCRKKLNKMKEESRVIHRIECEVIREGKLAPRNLTGI